MATNTTVIETSKACGVRSYIFIPCIVYGEGEGFGNRISIQTVAVVRAAKKLRTVYDVNSEGAVSDTSQVSTENGHLLTMHKRPGLFAISKIIQNCM